MSKIRKTLHPQNFVLKTPIVIQLKKKTTGAEMVDQADGVEDGIFCSDEEDDAKQDDDEICGESGEEEEEEEDEDENLFSDKDEEENADNDGESEYDQADLDAPGWRTLMREVRDKQTSIKSAWPEFQTVFSVCVSEKNSTGEHEAYCKRCKTLCLVRFACRGDHVSMCSQCFVDNVDKEDEMVLKCGRCHVSHPTTCMIRYFESAQRMIGGAEHTCALCHAKFTHAALFSHLLACAAMGKPSSQKVVNSVRSLVALLCQICRGCHGIKTPAVATSTMSNLRTCVGRMPVFMKRSEAEKRRSFFPSVCEDVNRKWQSWFSRVIPLPTPTSQMDID